ncbi:alpha/beta fold hydrolase [Candidatus Omnitrophota bacterium]
MSYIKAKSGVNWHYHSQGQGETVLFIHGWSFDAGIWFKQIDNFLGNYRVVTLDLPGHGQSDYIGELDTIEDINFIIRELGLDRTNLIGHSLGGLLSLKLVLKYPELIKKLVLIGAPAKFVRTQKHNFGLEEKDIDKLRSFLSDDYPDILLVFMRWLFTTQERNRADFREVWSKLSKKETWPQKKAMDDFLSMIEKEDITEQLGNLDIPTLIISGVNDPICPVESIDYLGRQIKNSRVELFKDCGHLPFLTQYQQFNRLAKEFIG